MKNNWQLFTRKKIETSNNSPLGDGGKKVAIVGAGPAGLSCAHVLSREGVDVTIYEKESKGGGLMTYGIAAYKVTPQFCEDEVNYILSLGGIEIKYNQELGNNISLAELQKNYDAVYLGIGVGLARQLDIPGEDLVGVEDAIKFIYDLRSKGFPAIPVGDKVAVIGMADVAESIMKKNNLTAQDIRWLVPHQANLRIISATAERMGLSMENVMVNIHKFGNTTAGTLPICLGEWWENGLLKKGDGIILATFGAGYTWGSGYLKWGY
jgi:glutamate synthase (NADPH/NADH) small chain